MARFKKEILDQIKGNPDLFAAVAKEMKVKPTSLSQILERNGNTLNRYSVVKLVADFLGKKPDTLLVKETVQG